MTLPTGHRFEATQALRQTLARAVEWGLIDTNPAKTGVDNPQPPRREMRPFDSDGQLEALAAELGPRYGPMILFAAATGLRPGEWIALEHRDIDLDDRLVHVCRAFRVNRLKTTKTNTARAVPLQRVRDRRARPAPLASAPSLLFPAPEGGYLDLHNWRSRHWRPAQRAAGITPTRRLYDLRHTFATVALRAGLGTYELSRYMGTSLINIDRTYGHLARDSHHHAIQLLDDYNSGQPPRGRWWTFRGRRDHRPADHRRGRNRLVAAPSRESPLPDSNRRPLPYHRSPVTLADPRRRAKAPA